MSKNFNDYRLEDIISFLKEEFERIITQYPKQRRGNCLSDAQALAIWFLHQETGLSYEEAGQFVVDETNDCGVDFIWVDKENRQILVGQIEYDNNSWSRNPANQKKAKETFNEFKNYLGSAAIPDRLHEAARPLWRDVKHYYANENYEIRFIFITPKYFSSNQEEKIRNESGILNYEFFTYDTLVERGREFLDGQTGCCSFSMPFTNKPLKIKNDFGSVYVLNVSLKDIHLIIKKHEKQKKLKALFASNVRSYLTIKKRSKEIAEAMRNTIKNEPEHFLVCNNGITIQCSQVDEIGRTLFLKRASISNGCQTTMNINLFFEENEGVNPMAEVLVTVIELSKNAPIIAGEIARSRNHQNPVDNRDLMSNDPLLVTLQHRLYADKLHGSEKKYYLIRKQGEKQTLLREEPNAKGKYMWIDADYLARCIAAVIRQSPYISLQGSNDIFGKYFKEVFPDVKDPTHSSCKFAYWLVTMISRSYDGKTRWKGVHDNLISRQKDFKNIAHWANAALIALQLKRKFSFNENFEKRFTEKAEKYWFNNKAKDSYEFQDISFSMIEAAYKLLHAIAKDFIGKKLPKSRDVITTYDDLFKGPYHEHLMARIRRGELKTYQYQLERAMLKFVEYLKNN